MPSSLVSCVQSAPNWTISNVLLAIYKHLYPLFMAHNFNRSQLSWSHAGVHIDVVIGHGIKISLSMRHYVGRWCMESKFRLSYRLHRRLKLSISYYFRLNWHIRWTECEEWEAKPNISRHPPIPTNCSRNFTEIESKRRNIDRNDFTKPYSMHTLSYDYD